MLKNKKIVYLITQSKYGGAQRYILDLADYFQTNNEVLIAVGEKNDQDPDFFNSAKDRGLKTIIIPSLKRGIDLGSNLVSLFDIYSLIKKEKPDVLHINSSMAGFVGAVAAFIYNLNPYARHMRVVYTAHGFVFNEPLPKWQKNFYTFLERLSAAWKHAIIAVSEVDRQSAITAGLKGGKIFTIHTGLPIEQQTNMSPSEARSKLGLPATGKIIGTIASHYPTKDLPTMIRAFAALTNNNLSLAIIGDGPETANLKKLIDELNATEHIFLVGARANAAQYLPAFDIFTLSSVKEGLPYAILEAGRAKLPTVATRVGGIPEIINDKKNGLLVEAGDPQALTQAYQYLLQNPESAKKFGQALYETIRDSFSQHTMIERTETLYERLFLQADRRS